LIFFSFSASRFRDVVWIVWYFDSLFNMYRAMLGWFVISAIFVFYVYLNNKQKLLGFRLVFCEYSVIPVTSPLTQVTPPLFYLSLPRTSVISTLWLPHNTSPFHPMDQWLMHYFYPIVAVTSTRSYHVYFYCYHNCYHTLTA